MLVPALVEIIVGKNEYGHPWDAGSRCGAVIALGLMGAEAASATSVLTSLLTDSVETIQVEAAATLGRIGAAARAAIPALLESLKTSDSVFVCAEVAHALTVLGEEEAVAGLIDALRDESRARPAGRVAAARALGELGSRAQEAVPTLTLLLDASHPGLRAQAAAALEQIRGDLR